MTPRRSTTFLSFTIRTNSPCWSKLTASPGTRSASRCFSAGTRIRTNKPGRIVRFGLAKIPATAAFPSLARRYGSKVQASFVGISVLVGQSEIDRYAALLYCRSGRGFLALDDPQEIAFVDREVYVDRVDLINETKGGLLPHGADNVAGIDEVSADPAVERRPHRCVTQI